MDIQPLIVPLTNKLKFDLNQAEYEGYQCGKKKLDEDKEARKKRKKEKKAKKEADAAQEKTE
jgi:hypothetical protein